MAADNVSRSPVRCASCDALLPAGASACPICRVPVPAPAGKASEQRVCALCGAVAPAGAPRCRVCGAKLPPAVPGVAPPRNG